MKNILAVAINDEIVSGIKERLRGQKFEVIGCPSLKQTLDFVKDQEISLILSSNRLPEDEDYREFCILVRSQEKIADIPIIVLDEAKEARDIRIEALRSVLVNDYLDFPISTEEIFARLNVFLQLRLLHEELEESAITDELTKLFNRRHIFERLKEEIERIRRYKYTFSCMIIDLDYFKKINDTFGHPVGDGVLIELSAFMRNNIRRIDILGRYGGEEFITILPYTNLEQGMVVAERLRKLVMEHKFPLLPEEVKLTLSIGLVSFVSGEKVDLEKAIQLADEQLYRAKQAGRNQTCAVNYQLQ